MIRTVDGYELKETVYKINKESIEEREESSIKNGDQLVIYYKEKLPSSEKIYSYKELLSFLFNSMKIKKIKKTSILIYTFKGDKKIELIEKIFKEEILEIKKENIGKTEKVEICFKTKNNSFYKKEDVDLKNIYTKENAEKLIYLFLKYFTNINKEKQLQLFFDKVFLKLIQNLLLHFRIKSSRIGDTLLIKDKSTILRTLNTFDIENDLPFRKLSAKIEEKYLLVASNQSFFYSNINYIGI